MTAAERVLARLLPGDLGAALWEAAGPEAERAVRKLWADGEPGPEQTEDTEALRTVLARAAALLLQQRLAEVIASLDELEEIQADELLARYPPDDE